MSTPWILAVSIGGGLLTLAAVWRGIVRPAWSWCSRKVRRAGDLIAVFTGRPESIDRLTGKKRDEVPSLVEALVQIRVKQEEQGQKQDEHGKALTKLTNVVTQVADQQITLHEHTRQIADLRHAQARLESADSTHETAIAALIAATFDRGAESALKAEELKTRDVIEEEQP